MTDESLRLFLERFREFNADIEARKKRGQNDFNPLLCVQKQDDEVNMHSGFLYALLNPSGEHYQDDLFLKLFLETIGLRDWFGNTNNAKVHKEKKRVDIYITNGEKYIIIENKIWASDGEKQIERYIEKIKEILESNKIESISYENIAVVYLAPYATRKPTKESLGKWQIQGDYLIDNENNKVRFQSISYKKEILEWLETTLNEVGGISNLRMAIECYTDVVKRITGQKENTMDLQAFFDKEDEKFLNIALELVARQEEVLQAQFSLIAKKIIKNIESNYKDYQVYKYTDCIEDIYCIDIFHKDFNKEELSFNICVWHINKKQIRFVVYLCENDTDISDISAIYEKLKEILCVDDSVLKIDDENNLIILQQYDKTISLTEFTQEKFIQFFEKVREQTDEFNQKIKEDFAKQDSKLRDFLPSND